MVTLYLSLLISAIVLTSRSYHGLLSEFTIRSAEIIEHFELLIFIERHHAVTFIAHVLLCSRCSFELPIATETKLAQLDSLRNIGKDAFKVDQTLDIKDGEVVSVSHVVEVFLHTLCLMITEEADTE